MAKERSEKSKYPSRYSPQGWVTAAQWLVEYLCEKKAKLDKKDLPTQFWQIPEWASFYRSQIHTANKLIKEYGEQVVIAAAKDQRASWMYSLRTPKFKAILLETRRNFVLQAQKQKTETPDYEAIDTSAKPIENFSSANKLGDKLKDL